MPAKTAARTALSCLYCAHEQTALFAGKPAPTGGNCCAGEDLKMRRPDGRAVYRQRPLPQQRICPSTDTNLQHVSNVVAILLRASCDLLAIMGWRLQA